MVKVIFQETEAEHAARLAVSRNYVRVRRRVLVERLGGPPAADRRGDNIPDRVRCAGATQLMMMLQVQVAEQARQTTRGDAPVRLAPVAAAELTEDLARGQVLTALRATAGVRLGGEGRPRRTLLAPFGYQRLADGRLVADPEHGPAVVEAFRLILAGAGRAGQAPWTAVAEELNRQGYRRRRGQPWRGDDVRDLTEVTTYAGYVRRNWRAGRGQEAELDRAAEISEPLVDPLVFYRAARLGRGRGTAWLRQLAAALGEPARRAGSVAAHRLEAPDAD